MLKILNGKAVTAKHLIECKIGKALTAVNDQPDPTRPSEDNPELLAELTRMKLHLKNKWKKVHAEYKAAKDAKKADGK